MFVGGEIMSGRGVDAYKGAERSVLCSRFGKALELTSHFALPIDDAVVGRPVIDWIGAGRGLHLQVFLLLLMLLRGLHELGRVLAVREEACME